MPLLAGYSNCQQPRLFREQLGWQSAGALDNSVGGGGWVLWISSDGDDWRIFWGLKFSIQGSQFLGRKIWQIFFSWLDLSRDFLGTDICIDSFLQSQKDIRNDRDD